MQVQEHLRADCKVAEFEQKRALKAPVVLSRMQGCLPSDWSSSSRGLSDFVAERVELR